MKGEELKVYNVSIDEEYSEDGEDLGIDLISNVKHPAVKVKGVAFSEKPEKGVIVRSYRLNRNFRAFTDDLKYRISAPVMIPDDIYRNDEEGEYYIRFTAEDIETIAKKFMKTLNSEKQVFNLEHGEKKVDSYILEAFIVDDEAKKQMVHDSYGINVPVGTFFVTQQFNDKELYNQLVSNGQTGFSLEGYLGMYLTDEKKKQKLNKNNMRKDLKKFIGRKMTYTRSKKAQFSDNQVFILAQKLEEDEKIEVIEEITEDPLTDFTGEIEVTDADGSATLIVEDGVITEVVADQEDVINALKPAEETEMEEDKEDKEDKEDEEKKKEKELEEDETKPETEDEELEGIYDVLAEIKNDLAEIKNEVEKEGEEEVMMTKAKSKFMDALIARALSSKK